LKDQASGVGGDSVPSPIEPAEPFPPDFFSEPAQPPVKDGVTPQPGPSVHSDDDVKSLSYEPSIAEENVEPDPDLDDQVRHDKRLSLEDYGDVSERPVKRRMYGKSSDPEGAFPPPSKGTPRGPGLKRPSEMNLKELEDELKKDDIDAIHSESQHWVSPFMNLATVVSQPPSMSHMLETEPVASVRFDSQGSIPESFVVNMGGMPIKIWCPTDAIDDTTGEILDGKKCHLGMKKEIEGLEECQAGDCYTVSEFEKLKERTDHPIRLISTRWVTNAKGDEVRSRMVVKDVKNKDSARSLGISSPTLGADAFQLFLTICSAWNFMVYTLDISHAFMYTPLRCRNVAVKLPMSCSTEAGEPVILHCANALNGLRSASLEWLLFLQQQLSGIGLHTDGAEPCFMAGILPSGRMAMVIVYVDDLAIACEHEDDFKLIMSCLQKKLKVKHTGTIEREGGQVTFLGREIVRLPGESALYVHLPDGYLDKTFEMWGLKASSSGKKTPCPNVLMILDQESAGSPPLSGEAYTKFRSTLGKIAWMSQTRQDLKHFVALLGTVQASPTQASEKALRALLRFLVTDDNVSLRLPSEHGLGSEDFCEVVAYTDASHAPSTRNRRGVSGGVLTYLEGVVKTYFRHQTSISLSSCESELQAIQMVVQEAVVLSRLLTRIMRALGFLKEGEFAVARIYSDSESALKLLKTLDLPRRSRHIDIKIEWLRELAGNGFISLHHLRGDLLVADLLTKCLQTSRYLELRQAMGFVQKPLTTALLSLMRPKTKFVGGGFALLEVCCDENYQLRAVCQAWGIPYRGITYGVEMRSVYERTRDWVATLKVGLHVHLSTLCSSGSPLRRFVTPGQASELDATWDEHISGAVAFMKFGESTSFELPLFNNIWKRWYVQQTLQRFGHENHAVVHLCQTGLQGSDESFIGKRLKFSTNFQKLGDHLRDKFGTCRCKRDHSNFNYITWRKTVLYNRCLAEQFIFGLQLHYGKSDKSGT